MADVLVKVIIAPKVENNQGLAISSYLTQCLTKVLQVAKVDFEFLNLLVYIISLITEFEPDYSLEIIDAIEFLGKLLVVTLWLLGKAEGWVECSAHHASLCLCIFRFKYYFLRPILIFIHIFSWNFVLYLHVILPVPVLIVDLVEILILEDVFELNLSYFVSSVFEC